MNQSSEEDKILDAAIELCCSFQEGDIETPNLFRARAARCIAGAIPSSLNTAFLAVMDDPKPFYDALRSVGYDDHQARGRLSALPLAAAGGYGLKRSDFRV